MLSLVISFDTPQTSSVYDIAATGTVAAYSIGHARITLNVTGSHPVRNDKFYRVINYDNTTSSIQIHVHGTYSMAIVPRVGCSHTVTPTISWSYTG